MSNSFQRYSRRGKEEKPLPKVGERQGKATQTNGWRFSLLRHPPKALARLRIIHVRKNDSSSSNEFCNLHRLCAKAFSRCAQFIFRCLVLQFLWCIICSDFVNHEEGQEAWRLSPVLSPWKFYVSCPLPSEI